MGWERRGDCYYYYRAKREGGRVVKEYVGAFRSEVIHCIADMDAAGAMHSRAQKHLRRYKQLTAKMVADREAAPLRKLEASCDTAARLAALVVQAQGYHRHDRGPWRKRRMKALVPVGGGGALGAKLGLVPVTTDDNIPTDHAARVDAIEWALDFPENQELQAKAAAILKKHPECAVSPQLADVGRSLDCYMATATLVDRQLVAVESDQMRVNLLDGRHISMVPYAEQLLIERVIGCRIAFYRAELEFEKQREKYHGKALEPYQRIFDRTHNRYLKAIKTLAEVRRLALPQINVAMAGAVQVNHGDKQINMTQAR